MDVTRDVINRGDCEWAGGNVLPSSSRDRLGTPHATGARVDLPSGGPVDWMHRALRLRRASTTALNQPSKFPVLDVLNYAASR